MEPYNEIWLCNIFDHSTRLESAQRKFEREHDWRKYQDRPWVDQPEYHDDPEVQDTKRRKLEEVEDVDPALDQGNTPSAQGI
jgi:hypothetical protein